MDWIFGYGSLMWNPCFAHQERRRAVLSGYHRAYAMYSTRNRGTPDCLGAVVSLAPGGSCTGVALGVDAADRAEALRYLDAREGEGRANRRVIVPLQLETGNGPVVHPAWAYLPIVTYSNYIGGVPLARQAELVARGCGKTGTAFDYLRLLLVELERLRIAEPELERLYEAARRVRRTLDAQFAATPAGLHDSSILAAK